jgi:hypothetical protein
VNLPGQGFLLYSVFRMDEWMEENGSSAADEEFVGAYGTSGTKL